MVSFILPAAIYAKVFYDPEGPPTFTYRKAQAIIVVGFAVMITVVAFTIMGVLN